MMSQLDAQALPEGSVDGAGVPEWLHLLPAGAIATRDGRGPYKIASMAALATLAPGEKLAVDECHAIDKGAGVGLPGRAVGWIVALEAREDGLWGRVEWNRSGQSLMEERAYAGVSPVIMHSADGTITRIARASLTNTPNLMGLTALHSEEEVTIMDWKNKLIELLGLDSDADDDAVMAALAAKMKNEASTAAPMGEQLDSPAVLALQSQLATVSGELNQLRTDRAREQAEGFVDAAIAEGRVGIKPLRDEYVALHMADAARAQKLIGGMPVVGGASRAAEVAPLADASGLDAADRQVIALMGISEDEYRERLKASGMKKETL